MNKRTKATDTMAELRVRIGFPKDAGLFMRMCFFLALAPLIFLRNKLGVRVVALFRLILFLVVESVWMAGLSFALGYGDRPRQVAMFVIGMGLVVGLFLIGVWKRLWRWIRRQSGEMLHGRSLGLSMLFRGVPNGNAERYLDPLLWIGAGVVMCLPQIQPLLRAAGSWFVLSGIALYVVEKYVHELQLNQYDDILSGEGLREITTLYRRQITGETEAAPPPAAPVSTGLDAALAAQIQRRAQRSEPLPAVPEGADAPAAAPQGGTAEPPGSSPQPAAVPAHRAQTEPSDAERSAPMPKPEAARTTIAAAVPMTQKTPIAWSSWAPWVISAVLAAVTLLVLVRPARTAPENMSASEAAGSEGSGSTGRPAAVKKSLTSDELLLENAKSAYFGRNGPPDKELAARLFELLAGNGVPEAQYMLGIMYELAEGGLPKDEAAAGQLYLKAAEKGFAPAQTSLADMLHFGRGTARNPDLALAWYRAAAERGEARAQFMLGMMLRSGQAGLAKSEAQALSFLIQSGKGGYPQSQTMLGAMYLTGTGGVQQDDAEAARWFGLAAEQEEPVALTELAKLHLDGKGGVALDPPKAAALLERASALDYGEAQVELAMLYVFGRGVGQDHARAVSLFVQAAANGNATAKRELALLAKQARRGDKGAAQLLTANKIPW